MTAAIVLVVAGVLFIAFGHTDISACQRADGSSSKPSDNPFQSAAFDAKWLAFLGATDSGVKGSVDVNDDEATSRASLYFQEQTKNVKDVVVCFEPGKASGSAKIKSVLGRWIEVSGEGTLDLSGSQPKLDLTSAHAGAVPVPGPLRRLIEQDVDDQLAALHLDKPLKLLFGYDKATVSTR